MKVTGWTYFYEPFTCGGELDQPARCDELNATLRVTLGNPATFHVDVYVVPRPSGRGNLIIERTSGGVVGSDLDEVRRDFETADRQVLARQLQAARHNRDRAKVVTAEEWWKRMDR